MSKRFLSPISLPQGTVNPATGSSGEIFYNTGNKNAYLHDGTSWNVLAGSVYNPISISPVAPTSPRGGDLWFDNVDGIKFMYYDEPRTNMLTNPNFESGVVGWDNMVVETVQPAYQGTQCGFVNSYPTTVACCSYRRARSYRLDRSSGLIAVQRSL